RFHAIDNFLKIVPNLCNRHAPKGVIDPELDEEDVDLTFEMRRQTLPSAGGCAAALARVGNLVIQTRFTQLIGQQRRPGLFRAQTKTSRQTVAENENSFHR